MIPENLRRVKLPSDRHGTHNLNSWAYQLGEDLETEEVAERKAALEYDIDNTPVDANYNRDQIEEACRNSLNFLAALAMPTVFRFDFPPLLLTAWDLLIDGAHAIKKLFPQLALGIPRGHAKTTLIKLFILYCILFTKKKFILVICSTADNAENVIADVAAMLDELNIIAVFGDWRQYREVNRQNLKKFTFRGRDLILGAIGSEGSIRGLNINNARPDVMIFEDVQTKECSESEQQSASLERWMIGTAMKAKSPYGCSFVFVGNMYPGPNSILKKLKNNPQWIKFVQGAILIDGTALWPELHSLEDLIAELNNDIAMGHPEIFFSEVMNDTEAGVNNNVDFTQIKTWPWGPLEKPQGKFIVIDPANNKQGGDTVNIGYYEVYDEIPGLRELVEDRLSPGNTIRRALLMAITNGCRVIAVESTAYQFSLLYWFGVICEQLGIEGIQVVDVYTGIQSKNFRINTMLKSLTSGDIVVHDSIKSRLANQIANWNPMKRDNVDGILDILTYADKVLELYRNEIYVDYSSDTMEANAARVQDNNSPF